MRDPNDARVLPVSLVGDELVDLIRQLRTEAQEAGEPPPGRVRLQEKTGATEHQIRGALAEIKNQDALRGDTGGEDDDQPSGAGPDSVSDAVAEAGLATAGVNAGEPGSQPPPPATPEAPTKPAKPRHLSLILPLAVIGLAAMVAVWSGWVGLGKLTGFGVIQPFPGIWDDLRINTCVALPISVEAYAAYALRCWLSGGQFSRRATNFAKWSAIASLVIGAGAQVAYHLMAAAGMERAPWWITVAVACVPVVVLGLASALAKLVANDHQAVPPVPAQPEIPPSFMALSIANGKPIAPAGDAWRGVGDRLANGGGNR